MIMAENDSLRTRKPFFKRLGHTMYGIVKSFNDMDSDYIEQQKYNYTVMLQNTYTYEMYELKTKNGNTLTLAPRTSVKLGPYIGWRWVFLGYQFDIGMMASAEDSRKKEFNLSLYSSLIGIDMYVRNTGNNYKIIKADLGPDIDTQNIKDVPFSGIKTSVAGFNMYYIFNHRKFSYPAAFSQSTRQKKSCGTALMGIGYNHQSFSLDFDKLQSTINQYTDTEAKVDSDMMFDKVKYTDISVSGGYAYNFVFARNLLLAASVSLAIGYKHSTSDISSKKGMFNDFSFNNFNLDGVGRFGVVWNNSRWYAGASAIMHGYTYRKTQISINNMFGSLNIYFGYNFGKR